jgi:hypothetical protein
MHPSTKENLINLDWNLKGVHSYAFKKYFRDMEEAIGDLNLVQLIITPTWSRMVQDVNKESILDHIYNRDPLSIVKLQFIKPSFGDHQLVLFKIELEKKNARVPFF